MSKRSRFLFLLMVGILLSVLPVLSAAEKKIVKPLPASLDPLRLSRVNAYGRITAYNEDDYSATVEFCVPELYDGEEILSLKPGDIIVSQGREVEVHSIDVSGDYGETFTMLWINDMADDPEDIFWMFINSSGECSHLKDECTVLMFLDPVQISLDNLTVFLDTKTPDTVSQLPAVYTPEEFLAKLTGNGNADDSNFASDTFWFIFDDYGSLVSIWRKDFPG